MKTNETLSVLFAGLLLIGTATTAVAQTESQGHDAHHPADTQAAPPVPTGDAPPPAGMQGGMPSMGMMTPEMMQMMQRMMGQGGMPGMMGQGGMPGMMRGMQGQGMPEGSMGSGMMGQMPMAGGMMMCPMMQMMEARSGAGMQAMMGGDAMLYGMPRGKVEEMTPERVRTFLEQRMEQHGNPRLKLGEIASAADGSITAEIVTVDGSLVQKLAFNRYPGLFRQITE
jgi:hypothetical protein